MLGVIKKSATVAKGIRLHSVGTTASPELLQEVDGFFVDLRGYKIQVNPRQRVGSIPEGISASSSLLNYVTAGLSTKENTLYLKRVVLVLRTSLSSCVWAG